MGGDVRGSGRRFATPARRARSLEGRPREGPQSSRSASRDDPRGAGDGRARMEMGVSLMNVAVKDGREWVGAAGRAAGPSVRSGGRPLLPRTMRLLWGVLVDLFHVGPEPELTIDLKRVNAELRKADTLGLEDDVDYRERGKQRIREGARCTLPPLIDRPKVLPFTARRAKA